MRARALRVDGDHVESALGSILATDARDASGRVVLRKGALLGDEDRASLRALAGRELHLVELEAGELPQAEAATRLAAAIAGPGTRLDEARQGQVRLRATGRGLLRVRADSVRAINASGALLCFTLPDGAVVVEGDEVAGAKASALATRVEDLLAAETLSRAAPVLAVRPFAPRRVDVMITERLEARGRELVAAAIRRKIEWYGSTLLGVALVRHEVGDVMERLGASRAAGAQVLLVSGANPLDPLDPVFVAVRSLGGAVLRTGVPAHPGSMVWTATLAGAPVLGIATCAGFGKSTALDLVLARVLSGEDLAEAGLALGHGGLLEGRAAALSFPPYERSDPSMLSEPAEPVVAS